MSANRNNNHHEFGGSNSPMYNGGGYQSPLKGMGIPLNGNNDQSSSHNSPRGSPKRAPPPANTSRNNAYQTDALQQAQLETVRKPPKGNSTRNNQMLMKTTDGHPLQVTNKTQNNRNANQQISSTTQRPLLNQNQNNQDRLAKSFNNNQVANQEQYVQGQQPPQANSSLSGNVRRDQQQATSRTRMPPTKPKDEVRASNGNIVANACGPLKKPRYVNPKIEKELVEFKQEIEDKFLKSALRTFVFPKKREGLGIQRKPDLVNDLEGPYNRIKNGRAVAQSTDASLMQQYLQNIQINGNGKLPQGGGTKRNQQMKSKLAGGISSLGNTNMGSSVLNSVTGLQNQNMGMQNSALSPQASYNFSGALGNDQSNGMLSVITGPSAQTKATSSTAEPPLQHHKNISMYAESQLQQPKNTNKRTKPRDNSRLGENQRQQQSQRFNKNMVNQQTDRSTSRDAHGQIVNIQRQTAEQVLSQQMETSAKKYIQQHQEERQIPGLTKNTFQDFYKNPQNQQRMNGQNMGMPKLPGAKMPGQHLRLDPIENNLVHGYQGGLTKNDSQFNGISSTKGSNHTRNRGAVAQSLNFAKGQLGGGHNMFSPQDQQQTSPERYNNKGNNAIGQATYNHRRNVQKAQINTQADQSPLAMHDREYTNNRILQSYNVRGNQVQSINSGAQQPRQGRMQGHNRALAALQNEQYSVSPGLPNVNQSINISPMQTSLIMQGNAGPSHQRNRNDTVSQSLMFPPAMKSTKKQL